MEMRQLRYFVAVARERNFSRAAEILNIAQPPLSRQVQQLEEELGVTLIDRSHRPLALTDAGQFLYEQFHQTLRHLDHIREETHRIGRLQRQRFIIGCVSSVLYSGIPDLVRRMRTHWPHLEIEIREMMSTQQVAALKEGSIDIGFGRLRFHDADLERLTLREEQLVAAFPSDHPKAGSRDAVMLAELEGGALIVYPVFPRPSFADEVLKLLSEYGINPGTITEARDIQTALGMVAAGAGVSIIPAAAQRQRPDDVCYRIVADDRAMSPIILSYRRRDRQDRIEPVKQFIRQTYAENPPWLRLSRVRFDTQ